MLPLKKIEFKSNSGKIYGKVDVPKYMYVDNENYFDFSENKLVKLNNHIPLLSFRNRIYNEEYISLFKEIKNNFKMSEDSLKEYTRILNHIDMPNRGIDTFRDTLPIYTDETFGSFEYEQSNNLNNFGFYLNINKDEVICLKKNKIFQRTSYFDSTKRLSINSQPIIKDIGLILHSLIKIREEFNEKYK